MYKQVTYKEVQELKSKVELILADVRDEGSFERGHIPSAIHLSIAALNEFCQSTALDTPILVYCYHGISSQSVAQHLVDQGFTEVYSLIGGFEVYISHHPTSDKNKS